MTKRFRIMKLQHIDGFHYPWHILPAHYFRGNRPLEWGERMEMLYGGVLGDFNKDWTFKMTFEEAIQEAERMAKRIRESEEMGNGN